jgi:hypothetical protein
VHLKSSVCRLSQIHDRSSVSWIYLHEHDRLSTTKRLESGIGPSFYQYAHFVEGSHTVSLYLSGIGVIRARPRRSTTITRIVLDKPNHSTIRATNHEKTSNGNHEHAPGRHKPPVCRPIVEEPHVAEWYEADWGTEQCTDQRDQAVEFWNSAGNDVCCEYDHEGT